MTVELIYFDIHGRGFLPRLVMAAAGIEFKDTRLTHPQFVEMKQRNPDLFPFRQIPVLITDDLVINQTAAIINWAVRSGDLPKLSVTEASKSDMVAETCKGIIEDVSSAANGEMQHIDASKWKERIAVFRQTAVAKFLEEIPKLEKILKHVGAGEAGIAPGKITLGDLYLLAIGHLSADLGQTAALPARRNSIAQNLRKNKRISEFIKRERNNNTKFYPF